MQLSSSCASNLLGLKDLTGFNKNALSPSYTSNLLGLKDITGFNKNALSPLYTSNLLGLKDLTGFSYLLPVHPGRMYPFGMLVNICIFHFYRAMQS
jgi:hypothetical protein